MCIMIPDLSVSTMPRGATLLPTFTKIFMPIGSHTLLNIFASRKSLRDKSIVPFYVSNHRNSNQLKID